MLYRNFRAARGGEIDLVCRDGNTLVFVEVKTRTSIAFGAPGEAVTSRKQRLIERGAMAWMKMLGNPADILFRFDIVEVLVSERKAEVNVIANAFQQSPHYRY